MLCLTRKAAAVFHVGDMKIENRKSFSLEGDGLSVSLCPADWVDISELPCDGNAFRISRTDGEKLIFVDLYALLENENHLRDIIDYCLTTGLAQKKTRYRSQVFDMESEELCFSNFDTIEEAIAETAYSTGLSKEDVSIERLLDQPCVYEIEDFVLTPAGAERNRGNDCSFGRAIDIMATMWCEDHLEADGIWYENEHIPEELSLPCAVIFTRKLELCDFIEEPIPQSRPSPDLEETQWPATTSIVSKNPDGYPTP